MRRDDVEVRMPRWAPSCHQVQRHEPTPSGPDCFAQPWATRASSIYRLGQIAIQSKESRQPLHSMQWHHPS
jgi:hypothetical protein